MHGTSIDPQIKRALRDNRGLRWHILTVLICANGPALIQDIASDLNISDRQIQTLLPHMQDDGYATHVRGGWIATTKARQLPLMPHLLEQVKQAHQTSLVARQSEQLPTSVDNNHTEIISGSEKISDRLVVVDQQDQALLKDQQQQTSAETGKNFRSEQDAAALRAVLQKNRVVGKKRRELLADHLVTAEIFEQWMVIAIGMELDNPAGYAINRCLEHEPPPDKVENIAKPGETNYLEERKAFYRSLPPTDRRLLDLNPLSRKLYLGELDD